MVIETGRPMAGAQLLTLEELPLEELPCENDSTLRLTAGARKIVTVGIQFG